MGRNHYTLSTTARNGHMVAMCLWSYQVAGTVCSGNLLWLSAILGYTAVHPISVYLAKTKLGSLLAWVSWLTFTLVDWVLLVPASLSPPVSCRSSVLLICKNREPKDSLL